MIKTLTLLDGFFKINLFIIPFIFLTCNTLFLIIKKLLITSITYNTVGFRIIQINKNNK